MTLSEVQFELKAPKGQFNKFGHYAYRSTEDILKAVKPLLQKFGDDLSLSDEPVLVGDWHYIKATATFTDKDGKQTTSTGFARESANKKGMDESQITGTASSYARKYALNGLFLIDDTKDADTSEYHQQNQQSAKTNRQRNNQQSVLIARKKAYTAVVKEIAQVNGTTTKEVNKGIAETLQAVPDYQSLSEDDKIIKSINVANKMLESAKQMQQEGQAG